MIKPIIRADSFKMCEFLCNNRYDCYDVLNVMKVISRSCDEVATSDEIAQNVDLISGVRQNYKGVFVKIRWA